MPCSLRSRALVHAVRTATVLATALSLAGCLAPIAERATGSWHSPGCDMLVGPGALALHGVRHVVLTETTADIRTDYFDDAFCTVPTATVEVSGAWRPGATEIAGMPGVFTADFDLGQETVTSWIPRLSSYVMMMNCGSQAWNIQVPQDTTASGCFGFPAAAACPTYYTLIEVQNGQLFFGAQPADGRAVCDPTLRPSALDSQPLVPGN